MWLLYFVFSLIVGCCGTAGIEFLFQRLGKLVIFVAHRLVHGLPQDIPFNGVYGHGYCTVLLVADAGSAQQFFGYEKGTPDSNARAMASEVRESTSRTSSPRSKSIDEQNVPSFML